MKCNYKCKICKYECKGCSGGRGDFCEDCMKKSQDNRHQERRFPRLPYCRSFTVLGDGFVTEYWKYDA